MLAFLGNLHTKPSARVVINLKALLLIGHQCFGDNEPKNRYNTNHEGITT